MSPPCYMNGPPENARRPTRKQLKAIVRKAAVAQPAKQTATQPAPQPVPQPARQFSKPPGNTAGACERQRKIDAHARELKEKDREIAALKRRVENAPLEKRLRFNGGLGSRLAKFAASMRLRK